MALIAKCLLLVYMIVIVRGTSIFQKFQMSITRHSAKENEGICGKKNGNSLKKIVGGSPTGVNEYPWQVALVRRSNIIDPYYGPQCGGSNVQCGGSLINDRWVLTAAHCNPDPVDHLVLLGSHYANYWDLSELGVVINGVVIHPYYKRGARFDYDFALLELATTLDLKNLAPDIGPVCLPSIDPPSPYGAVSSIVTGWGATSSGGKKSNVLLEATVTTMSNSKCSKDYSKIGKKILPSMICAAAKGKDSCQGDSGGPLVTEVGGSFILIGVVSWGDGCADPGFPGVYGRVTEAIGWITTTINN